MRTSMVLLIFLVIATLMISTAVAVSSPFNLQKMSLSGQGASTGSNSNPAGSGLGVSYPAKSYTDNYGSLKNMQFFKPSRASQQPTENMVNSGLNPIVDMLSIAPITQVAAPQTASAATPTPSATPAPEFTDISSMIPTDMIIFVEVTKQVTSIDPTNEGFNVPNVTLNYKYDQNNKILMLKKKNTTDYNSSQIYFGYIEDNGVTNHYIYDYDIGRCSYVNVPVKFTGSDGRVSIALNGSIVDLKPGNQTSYSYNSGNTKITITAANWGLVPKANIQVKDQI